jgi:hypothetical protein
VAGLDQPIDEAGHRRTGHAREVGQLGGGEAVLARRLVERHQDLPATAGEAAGLVVLLEGRVELLVEVQERDAGRNGVAVETGDGPRELLELLEPGADG